MVKHTVADIRRTNCLAVLRQIYAVEAPNRQLLTQRSGLSTATVGNVVTDLIEASLVVEAGYEQSQGGRPRTILAINSGGGCLVGVDIAETYIHFELFDLRLTRLHSVEYLLSPNESQPAQIVERLACGLDELLRSADVPCADILGVGISVPGLVDPAGGGAVFAPNWGWHDVPLLSLLRAQIDLPLYLENPLKAIAVSELWFGAGRGADTLIVLNIGTGVGAGIIINGELYRGAINGAGEWGHTTIALDGRACHCGSVGCIESYVGAPGIIQHIREIDPHSPLLASGDQTTTIDSLAAAADRGDPTAIAAIRTTAQYLGAGVANLINLCNPEVIVLGGWVSRRIGQHLLPELQRVARRFALAHSFQSTRFELCALRHNPVSIGVATFALEGYMATMEKERGAARA